MKRMNKQKRQLRACLAGANFSGQHLLHNKQIVKEMIELAGIRNTDTVLEIGAGKGALTLSLAEKAGEVLAVEYDQKFVDILREKLSQYKNTTIIYQDFLTVPLPRKPFHVVANIPYSITTAILKKLLAPETALQRAVLMVEKGAAIRFTQSPVTNPRILAWRMRFELKKTRTVTRYNFAPPPRVDSALLLIERRREPLMEENQYNRFLALAEHGLYYPRQPIRDALAHIFTKRQMSQLLRNLGVEQEQPICVLTEKQWAIVFATMLQHVDPSRWPRKNKSRRSR